MPAAGCGGVGIAERPFQPAGDDRSGFDAVGRVAPQRRVGLAMHQAEVVLPGTDHHVGPHRPVVGEVEGVVAEHVVQSGEHQERG